MDWKKFALEAIALVVLAAVCAMVSNGLAARERKLVLAGTYPNALKVPVQTEEPPSAPSEAALSSPAPVPVTASVPVTTTSAGEGAVALPKPLPASSNQQPATAAKPPKPAVDLSKFTPHPDKPYVEIAFADVKALHGAGALILDARRTSIFEQGHIAGARPFSVWESDVDEKVNKLFEERGDPREQLAPIVIYCSGGECEDSHMLAQKLWGVQFNNVYVYKDGFPDWQSKGGAVRTGPNP